MQKEQVRNDESFCLLFPFHFTVMLMEICGDTDVPETALSSGKSPPTWFNAALLFPFFLFLKSLIVDELKDLNFPLLTLKTYIGLKQKHFGNACLV